MSVYVDPLMLWPRGRWCHMVADSVEELHAFAASIGMKRSWYQGPKNGRLPHYDLVPSKRQLAVEHGAIEISRKELTEKIRKHREAKSSKRINNSVNQMEATQ